jgi:hypothetical protein
MLVLVPPAGAVKVIGSKVTGDPNGAGVFSGGTWAQQSLPFSQTAVDGLTSPIDGVVVRWRLKVGDIQGAGGGAALRIIRPGATDDAATGAGTSPSGTMQVGLNEFPVSPGLPIRQGEGIGVDPEITATVVDISAGTISGWEPVLVNGAPSRLPSFSFAPRWLQLQADVEADKDGDKLGDESQDPDGGNPPPPQPPASPPCALNLNILHIRIGNLCL